MYLKSDGKEIIIIGPDKDIKTTIPIGSWFCVVETKDKLFVDGAEVKK